MNRLLRLAIRLYPSWWRQRYATEFEALLDDVTPGWRELFDILQGALTMQLRSGDLVGQGESSNTAWASVPGQETICIGW